MYAQRKLERHVRRLTRKLHNIFQQNKTVVKYEKTPKKEISMDCLTNTISPLSISTDLEPRFKLSPSMLNKSSKKSKATSKVASRASSKFISESKSEPFNKEKKRKKQKQKDKEDYE